jgi:hypothetical protein
MKYYLACATIYDGWNEYNSKGITKGKDIHDAHIRAVREYAKGGSWKKDEDRPEYDLYDGECGVDFYLVEIPKADYAVLRKYLCEY